jgi:hypothetical protein
LNKIPILDETSEQNEYLLIFSNDENKNKLALNENDAMDEDDIENAELVGDNKIEMYDSNDGFNDDEHEIEKFNNKINHSLLNDLLSILDSKEFANKINSYFLNNTKIDLNDICFYTSHICYFVLIKTSLKMHQSM